MSRLHPIDAPKKFTPYLVKLSQLRALPIGEIRVESDDVVAIWQVWTIIHDQHNPPLRIWIRGDYASVDVEVIEEIVSRYERSCSFTVSDGFDLPNVKPIVFNARVILGDTSYLVSSGLDWLTDDADVAMQRWGHLHHAWWFEYLIGPDEEPVGNDSIRTKLLRFLKGSKRMVSLETINEKLDVNPTSLERELSRLVKEGEAKVRRYKTSSGREPRWGAN